MDSNKISAISRWREEHDKQRKKINSDERYSHLKCRLCGYIAGDGNIDIRKEKSGTTHHEIRFYPDDLSMLNSFTEAFRTIYPFKDLSIKKMKNFYYVRCYSKVISEDLLKICKFGTSEWRAPWSMLKTEKSKIEWLRALFDSEGYVGNNHIKLQTINENGMIDVMNILKELGINPRFYTHQPKNDKWKRVYIIHIRGKKDINTFLNRIGFNHIRKQSELIEMSGWRNLVNAPVF